MRFFLLRVFGFFFLLAAVLWGGRSLAPYYYANPILVDKFTHLRSENDYNMVIFGSSRTFRQVDARLLDEALDLGKRTFNLGAGGTFGLEVLYNAEHFLRSNDLRDLELLMVEIQLPQIIDDSNMHVPRSKYFLDYERYLCAVDFSAKYYSRPEAIEYIQNFTNSWLEQLFNIGLVRAQLYGILSRIKVGGTVYDERSGFIPLDDELPRKSYVKRRDEFLQNINSYEAEFRFGIADRQTTIRDIGTKYLQAHQDLIELGQQQGVRVIFVLLPSGFQLDQQDTQLLYGLLPEGAKIDVGSYEKWPMLYDSNLYFDRGHLNEEGATLLTSILATELRQVLDRD